MAEMLIGGLIAAGQEDVKSTQPTHEAADNNKAISRQDLVCLAVQSLVGCISRVFQGERRDEMSQNQTKSLELCIVLLHGAAADLYKCICIRADCGRRQ